MKKRLFTSVLSIVCFIVMSVFGFAACDGLLGGNNSSAPTIALNASAKELVVGESLTLTATTSPADATVVWESSDATVATVNGGLVVAVKVGTATITAKNDTATATCQITVTAPMVEKYNVVFKNGEAELKSVEVEKGAKVSYNGAIPSKAATEEYFYTFSGWATTENGEVVDISALSITEDKTFYAVFTATAHSYTVTWSVNGETTAQTLAYGATPEYTGETPAKPAVGNMTYTFKGWSATENGEVLTTLPKVKGDVTYYAVFEEKEEIQVNDFADGVIKYSNNSQEIFMPKGLLTNGATLVKVTLQSEDAADVVVYENGEWAYSAIALTEEEMNTNQVGMRKTLVELSDGTVSSVKLYVYAGVIDELSDFPKFFNNEANAEGVAPTTYGYYIVANDLGTGVEELAFTQCAATDYSRTSGFNGVLDGQGHTLRFKLTSGGLVGMVLGNAVIKDLGIIFEDATTTSYGVFGYITSGAPEIRNCYIEQTNNHFKKTTTFGVMARPNGKLRLHNTVVYGYNISMNSTWENPFINETSTNAYVIHGRANANTLSMSTNFTKVFNDGIENGAREVLLSEIDDASGFNDNCWLKEDGKLVWKGLKNEGSGTVTPPAQNTIAEAILYSCGDNELFLPAEITFTLDETVTITSADGATVYYQNGAWVNSFALTDEEMKANTIGSFNVKIMKGEDVYTATVKSYAGVIDELSDFPKFFNNDPTQNAPVMYGYYIVTKNLGDGTDTLAFTQTTMTDYSKTSGFNGVLDGQGYTLKFKLTSGGLVGMILGNAVIKNLGIIFEDATTTKYGVFGYLTNGAPEIRNCYIQQTNNHYDKTTCWGLMARPNGKLRLHNTVVFGSNISFDDTSWNTTNINENSSNAFVIWARATATSFGIATNFTEVSTSGALTSDLSVLDSNYWTTTDNKPAWKSATDKVYTSVELA